VRSGTISLMSLTPVRCALACGLALAAAATPASTAAAATPTEAQAREIGAQAYVYGLAPVDERRVTSAFPANTLLNVTRPATPAERLVVLPNVDTLYTTARLDLGAGPVVIHVPDEAGRYYVLQLLDAYTNTFGSIGRRTTGTREGDYAITPPGWSGTLPAGVHRIEAPTRTAWLLGRTLVDGPDDLAAVNAIQHAYALTPLSGFVGAPSPAVFVPEARLPAPPLPEGLAFFDALGAVMAENPPPPSDRALVARLAKVGIGPGRTPSAASLPQDVRDGLLAGIRAGRKRIARYAAGLIAASERRHNGWLVPPKATGDFGTHRLLRAFTAQTALGVNRPAEAVYPSTSTDSNGHPLSGRHRYVLHFAKGQLPPVKAFWSLTMYDEAHFLVANPIGRYAIGDRSPGLRRNRDGSLDVLLASSRPAHRTANWLPAPKGRFHLALRLYEPKASVLADRWPLPAIRRVG
jgi:hypothetical protein